MLMSEMCLPCNISALKLKLRLLVTSSYWLHQFMGCDQFNQRVIISSNYPEILKKKSEKTDVVQQKQMFLIFC